MIPEYTALAVAAVGVVVVAELAWLRTGALAMRAYWITVSVALAVQVVVDARLTKLPHAVVIYDPTENLGVMIPFDTPAENLLFGYALVTASVVAWLRAGDAQVSGRDRR